MMIPAAEQVGELTDTLHDHSLPLPHGPDRHHPRDQTDTTNEPTAVAVVDLQSTPNEAA